MKSKEEYDRATIENIKSFGGEGDDDDIIDSELSNNNINTARTARDLEFYKQLLSYCYQRRLVDLAELIETKMEKEKIYPDLEIFNSKLKMSAQLGHILSSNVLEQHSLSRVKPNGHTFLALLYSSLVKFEELAESRHLMKSLQQEMKQYRDQRPMNHAILAYSLAYYSHPSQAIIKVLDDLNTNEFTPAILDLIVYGYSLNNNKHRKSLLKNKSQQKDNIIDNNGQASNNNINRFKELRKIIEYINNRFNIKPDNDSLQYIKEQIKHSTLPKKSKTSLINKF
ncbi:hypothetical protein PPL_09701 [Heterostelium album PN500]|uniref:Pentatricopeptide repeat-containing protein n=1 Tax=Heterostelium pallidum (strain ATCC 26659 / Pp 5 / PN500) TaxID=670386 RepID=D3BNJ8_HETP5|nr:hypothetical protein PPL_09701 [Heterostelium album PN500]EFA76949.1 hypothetical protein PPL_09701 [Heterostelium album PN500]|eukprot:XP_020429081.1 hypothetical protein PPL_09701 [Heterostelium album PN500]